MPESILPRKYGIADLQPYTEVCSKWKKNLQDALTDEKPECPTPRKYPFDANVTLSPFSEYKLKKALVDDNAWADPRDRITQESWVDRNVKELYEACAERRMTESSPWDSSEVAAMCEAERGDAQDLRDTLVGSPVFAVAGAQMLMSGSYTL